MFIKLIGLIVGLIVSIINIIKDKVEGKPLTRINKLLLLSLFITSLIAAIIIIQDSIEQENKYNQQSEILQRSRDTITSLKMLSKSDSTTISLLNQQIAVSKENEASAKKEREDLKELFEPIQELAIMKYPNLNIESALEKLHNQLTENNERVTIIEGKIKPRTISSEKMAILIERMKPVSKNIVIKCMANDPESMFLFEQIVDIFNRDGRSFRFEHITSFKPTFGLYIIGKNNELDNETKLILENFEFLGMQMAELASKNYSDLTQIIIGANPNNK